MSNRPEQGPRCGECRLGLGVHDTADPLCVHHAHGTADPLCLHHAPARQALDAVQLSMDLRG